MARDEDEGENGRVSYRIQAGNNAGRFSLNANTGELIFGLSHNILKVLLCSNAITGFSETGNFT